MKTVRTSPSLDRFTTGQTVRRSGTYKTMHPHRLTAEITLLSRQVFPNCPSCAIPVSFAMVSRPATESASARFRLLMNT